MTILTVRRIGVGVFLLLSFFSAPSVAAAKDAEPPTLDALAHQLRTPELLEKFMSKHFLYLGDPALFGREEYWQTPEEMAGREEGDCEDFAGFAEAILKRNGYHTFLFSVYGEDDAHTVTVFEREGKWGLFDLDRLLYLKHDSLEEVGDKIKPHWSYLGLMRREGNFGLISRKFRAGKIKDFNLSLLSSHS